MQAMHKGLFVGFMGNWDIPGLRNFLTEIKVPAFDETRGPFEIPAPKEPFYACSIYEKYFIETKFFQILNNTHSFSF